MRKVKYILMFMGLMIINTLKSQEEGFCTAYPSEASLIYMAQNNPYVGNSILLNENSVVPVTVHIVRQGDGNGGVEIVDIKNAVNDLNLAFSNSKLSFSINGAINFIDDDSIFNFYKELDIENVTNTYAVANTLNLFVVNKIIGGNQSDPEGCGSNINGFASFPGEVSSPYLDCTFMTKQAIVGSTLIHEVGHYFGLHHTHGKFNSHLSEGCFEINSTTFSDDVFCAGAVMFNNSFSDINNDNIPDCAQTGDDICDTPAEPPSPSLSSDCNYLDKAWNTTLDLNGNGTSNNGTWPNGKCIIGGWEDNPTDPNGDEYILENITNYMSYLSPRACRSSFTPDQIIRTEYYYNNHRFYLKNLFLGELSSIFSCQENISIDWYANEDFVGKIISIEYAVENDLYIEIAQQTATLGWNTTEWQIPGIVSQDLRIRVRHIESNISDFGNNFIVLSDNSSFCSELNTGPCLSIVFADYGYDCGGRFLPLTVGAQWNYNGRDCGVDDDTNDDNGGGNNGGGSTNGDGGPGRVTGLGGIFTATGSSNVPVISENNECQECVKELQRKAELLNQNQNQGGN